MTLLRGGLLVQEALEGLPYEILHRPAGLLCEILQPAVLSPVELDARGKESLHGVGEQRRGFVHVVCHRHSHLSYRSRAPYASCPPAHGASGMLGYEAASRHTSGFSSLSS